MEHKHIKFHEGHITWLGDEKPSEAVMEAFEVMYQFILNHEKEIRNLDKIKQNTPAIYGPPPFTLDDPFWNNKPL
jgi:hypothetical protein